MGIWSLGPFSSDSPSQLDILWHDGHTLGVDGAQVGVLEETNQVSLTGLLKWEKTRISNYGNTRVRTLVKKCQKPLNLQKKN